MTFEPDLADPETDGSIFDRIASTIASLSPITNFSVNSPERALISGVSDELRERQHELLSVQLSARVDFAGRTLTQSDLESLNVDASKVNLELLNSFQADSDLDAVAARNGISRDPGSFASGDVVFQITSDAAVIPEGTEVTTDPVGVRLDCGSFDECVVSCGVPLRPPRSFRSLLEAGARLEGADPLW